MIYAIILIVLGAIAVLLNKKSMSSRLAAVQAWLAIVYIVWGTGGLVILNTIRYSVRADNPIYWTLLIIGSAIEVATGIYFIYNYFAIRKNGKSERKPQLHVYQNILAILAIIIGVATLIVF